MQGEDTGVVQRPYESSVAVDDEHLYWPYENEYWRDEFIQVVTRMGKDAFRPALREAMGLWNACADEYGRGYGFRDRVAVHFRNWFEDPTQSGIFQLIERALAEQWSSSFTDNLEKLMVSVRPHATANVLQ